MKSDNCAIPPLSHAREGGMRRSYSGKPSSFSRSSASSATSRCTIRRIGMAGLLPNIREFSPSNTKHGMPEPSSRSRAIRIWIGSMPARTSTSSDSSRGAEVSFGSLAMETILTPSLGAARLVRLGRRGNAADSIVENHRNANHQQHRDDRIEAMEVGAERAPVLPQLHPEVGERETPWIGTGERVDSEGQQAHPRDS